jgi:23S rRNA-/tRNA-specific pseudouridylate synthase
MFGWILLFVVEGRALMVLRSNYQHRCANKRMTVRMIPASSTGSSPYSEDKSNHFHREYHSFNITADIALHEKYRLDSFLSERFSQYSRNQIGKMCEVGLVKVNGISKNKSYKIHRNDFIEFSMVDNQISEIQPENIPLDIIYEDHHILAINKPKGMVVHPAIGSPNGTFVNALLHHLGAKKADDWFSRDFVTRLDKKGESQILSLEPDLLTLSESEMEDEDGDVSDPLGVLDLPETPEAARASPLYLRPGIVHRLDKGTSGVLLAAKNPVALAKVSKLFAQREVSKTYLAICVGHPGDTTITEPLARSTKNRQIMTVWDGPEGKLAITHTRTLCFDGRLSVVLVRIETGRTHQIRVHLQHRRTPILGDSTYGNLAWNKRFGASYGINRPMLHAYETQLVHPFTQKTVCLTAPLPEDFRTIMAAISKHSLISTASRDGLFDPHSHFLLGSTAVDGREAVEIESYRENEYNLDEFDSMSMPKVSQTTRAPRVYVPSERLRLDENDDDQWLRLNLSELDS